jgi:hypothetical protein
VDRYLSGGFPASKAPPSDGSAIPTPCPDAELSLATDASDTQIGGLENISGPLVLLTANYWPLRQQSNISVISAKAIISAKVVFSNFGPTTNPLLLPFLVFQYQFRPDNSATWHLFQSSMYSVVVFAWSEKSCWQFFVPPTPLSHWISRCHNGGRSCGFRRDGRWAKLLPRNAAFAGQHIPQIGLPPDRRPTPGWRCFHRHFSPNCPPQVQKIYFFALS